MCARRGPRLARILTGAEITDSMSEFSTEESLVLAFLDGRESVGEEVLSGPRAVLREFFYSRGKTDVVFVLDDGEVVAFEAKLSRWRSALDQAYRNTCFAHRSFVVLPWHTAQIAARAGGEFIRRRVGICAVRDREVSIIRHADPVEPVEPWLSDLARQRAFAAFGGGE